jgi:hypothetical protein
MLAVPGADEIGIDLYIVGQVLAPFATAVGKCFPLSANLTIFYISSESNCYYDEKVLNVFSKSCFDLNSGRRASNPCL